MFHINDRETVIPGQLLGVDIRHDANCFSDGSNVYSLVRGLARVDNQGVSVIPAKGGYSPRREDTVIGIITDENVAGWVVDINNAYRCFMRKDEVNERERPGQGRGGFRPGNRDNRDRGGRDRNQRGGDFAPRKEVSFKIGEVVSAKILSVDEVYDANLTRPWKLEGGMVLQVNPKRIPRVIGKSQSMLTMLKEKTGCKIVTGQNGLVWIKGENATIAAEAVRKIEREAETQGLTDQVAKFLNEKVKSVSRVDENEENRY